MPSWLICRVWVVPGVDAEMSATELDLNQLRAILLVALMFGFLGICAWAWSSKRKPAFRDASMLPLQDDQAMASNDGKKQPGTRE
jgi:cytochrome c oxidase cbb3-type subunit IV